MILESLLGYIAVMVFAGGALGLLSRSFSVAVLPAYMLFAYLAISVDDSFLTNILIVTLVLMAVAVGFKLLRAEMPGGER